MSGSPNLATHHEISRALREEGVTNEGNSRRDNLQGKGIAPLPTGARGNDAFRAIVDPITACYTTHDIDIVESCLHVSEPLRSYFGDVYRTRGHT
jgi:hypothetical protein